MRILKLANSVSNSLVNFISFLGNVCIIFYNLIRRVDDVYKSPKLLLNQFYFLGIKTLPIIVFSSLFIGMVLGLQGYIILKKFNTEVVLGQLVALSLIRELAPVISAILYAGRAGASITAEISLMKTTDQLLALSVFGVSPFARVFFPRFLAGIIILPLLNFIFILVAIYGGYLIGVSWKDINAFVFWGYMQKSVSFDYDVYYSMIKSVTFSIFINYIAIYQGYNAEPNSKGIGSSTTNTVVYSTLIILFFDFILTLFIYGY